MAYAMYWTRVQAQKKAAAQAAAQAGQGDPAAVAPEINGCPAPVVKIEDSVANKVHVADPLYTLGTRLTPSDRPVPTNQQHVITPTKAVFCGGRESSLPPGYRFQGMNVPKEKTDDKPQVVPTPLSTDNALDSLSAGFTSSASIAQVEEPIITDFSLPATLSFTQPPADKRTRTEGSSMPLDDALNALGDTLAAPEPAPEPPKIDPKDIVTEDDLGTEEGVLVGEREDTLPPDYRFTEENGTDLSPPKEEKPPMDSGEALDILSGDFMSQTPVTIPAGAPKQPCMEALDMLDGDSVAAAAQLSAGTIDDLDGLSDSPSAPELALDPIPESAPDSAPEQATEITPEYTPYMATEFTHELATDSAPEVATDFGPETTLKWAPDFNSESATEFTPELDAHSTPDSTPEPAPEFTPDLALEFTLELANDSAPELDADSTPELAYKITPDLAPDFDSEPAPDLAPEFTPELAPEFTPELTPEFTPELTPEFTPESAFKFVPDFNSELAPNLAPEFTHELANDSVPELTSDTNPELAPDPSPELAPDSTSGSEPAPDLAPEFTPELANDSVPELNADSTPDPIPELAPEFTPELTSDTNPELAPVPNPELAPDPSPELAPDSTPVLAPEFTPVLAPEFTPELGADSSPKSVREPATVPSKDIIQVRLHNDPPSGHPDPKGGHGACPELNIQGQPEAQLTLSGNRQTEGRRDEGTELQI
ncbi:hypothetical protein AAFF_G00378720 [Aldrovandia affinis]|uniref:Calpastatin n=1 Tax=Aldrovandia affinis TaxID=143900 RepID=A0AAD7SFC1_9TELE|nr:hypothetical protein AAFF_G00378720 [Aldrovandia affinis]